MQKCYLALGCFWKPEETFRSIKGIVETEVGYAGGKNKEVTYEEICTGNTGHAETVKITFDEKFISFEKILEYFFNIHDPTQKDMQYPDVGTQYRSEIFYENEEQKNKKLELLSEKHNSDGSLVKIFGGKTRNQNQDEEREDLIRELNKGRKTIEKSLAKEKANIIKNFPVPNSREDLLELLAMASSNAYDNDGHVGHEEEVWIQKTDQIYSKVKVSSDKDPELLDQATNMVVSLMKKLPSKYKKFTTFPESIKGKIQSELDGDKQRRRENQIKAGKPYAIATGSTILLMIISGLFNGGAITFIFFVLTVVSISLLVRAVKKSNEINF